MSSFGGKVLTGSVLAVIGLVTVKVLVAVVTGFFALLSFLIFTVLPIVVVGWIIMRLLRRGGSDKPAFE
jgi:membrane protein DedA with SNARE-associated domain